MEQLLAKLLLPFIAITGNAVDFHVSSLFRFGFLFFDLFQFSCFTLSDWPLSPISLITD